MKKIFLPIVVSMACIISGCDSNTPPQELSKIAALKSHQPDKINEIRLAALTQTARGIGAQAGLAWRSKQINVTLNKQKRNLDHVFDFNYLLLEHNVLPPVLMESRNTLNLADQNTIRAADRTYKIVYPPRFVTAPPTWRDYIWMAYKRPETPSNSLLPRGPDERAVWNEYTNMGWSEGIAQADEIFTANIARLSRDIQGMILYRKLLAQNMVSAPFVSQADLGVTGGGNDLNINDRILRITTIPELKANPKVWNPVVAGKKNTGDENILTSQSKKTKDKI
ncbi:MAG: type IV secretion system DotC family protein [Gammaproteobacteria bacterium]|nr:type IV secretion system DotC family protein [Gammaproteobacteria bacterium]